MSTSAVAWQRARLVLAAAAALIVCGLAVAQALQPIPSLTMRVTDVTGTLTAAQQSELEQRLADFEARKGAQIAVLIVPTTAPEEIEQYSIRVVEAWKLGRKGVDDGALLIIAKNDRHLRIENGYGLEGVITDAASNRIIEDTMVPLLRQGQYYEAISAGVDQMMKLIEGEPLPPPQQHWQGKGHSNFFLPLLIVFFIGAKLLRAFFGQTAGAAVSGTAIGVITLLVTQVIGYAIGAGVLAFVVAWLLGLGSGGWTSGGRGGIGGFGGSFGGFGGGGGGFGGGFSGGGGSFGGGGASGSW